MKGILPLLSVRLPVRSEDSPFQLPCRLPEYQSIDLIFRECLSVFAAHFLPVLAGHVTHIARIESHLWHRSGIIIGWIASFVYLAC